MSAEKHADAVHLLFGSMVDKLDILRKAGVEIPTDVYLNLGELRANMTGYLLHVATRHESEVAEWEALFAAEPEEEEVEEVEEDEELTRMEQVSAKHRNKDFVDPPTGTDPDRPRGQERSPLTRRQNVVKMRNED